MLSKTQNQRRKSYPLAENIPQSQLDAEVAELARLQNVPLLLRLPTYLKLGGPGFMGAAMTLGAGSLTAAMLSGAQFGYRTLWVVWIAMGTGVFMMAAMARFTTKGGFRIIQRQAEVHGWFVAKVLTALVGVVSVAVIFNFGQVALGTHLIEALAGQAGVNAPRDLNWPIYALITAWIALSYGKNRGRGTYFVESLMKGALLLMVLSFAACLFVVGVDWGQLVNGLFIPWLPNGRDGIDLFILSSAAAIGVMDWVFFQYSSLAKGWTREHEALARFDIGFGLAIPYILIYIIVVSVFAATFYGSKEMPQSAEELSRALIPLLGTGGATAAFLLGFLAVPITTTVTMSIACAVAMHEIFNWEPDVDSIRWKLCVLLPQIALLGAWLPNPLIAIVVIGAFLALTNNFVGWSFYLMLNDVKVMGNDRSKSWFWNVGILLQITLLNCVALMWIFNRFGLWE